MLLRVSNNLYIPKSQIVEPIISSPRPCLDMLKFDLAIPEGALLGNLAKYISKPFEKRTGLTCHLDPIHTVNERWYKLTVSIHKPRSTKDIITFLDIARAWKAIAFLGFCYGEFGLDTYVKNWVDMSEESHKTELGYTLAHFLDRKRDFGCLNGHRLHAFKHRSTFADDNIEGIDVDHIADLTRRGYNLRLGNKNCSREVKYHFGDLYYHLYVKTFDAQQERFLDRASWRARRELNRPELTRHSLASLKIGFQNPQATSRW